MKYIFIFIASVLIGVIAVFGYKIITISPGKPVTNIIQNVAKPSFDIADAPSTTLRGTISAISGQNFWESRTATESSELIDGSGKTVQQGEEYQTGENGGVTITFLNEAQIKINPKTQIDFVQTLPSEFLISIASGSAEFTKNTINSISVRAMHLLIRQNTGVLSVAVDEDNTLLHLKVIKGSITIGFNDNNLISHTADFDEGKNILFNDQTRSFELE